MNKDTFEFENKIYPVIELENFDTADGCHVDYAVFTSDDFLDVCTDYFADESVDEVYGYLPREVIEKGTESEIRKYILENIG